MGFTLSEIKVFLNGLRDDAPVGPRWKSLAQRKIREVEETIQQSRRLKLLLQHLLGCSCASLQVCVQRLSLSSNLRLLGPRGKTRSSKMRRQSRSSLSKNHAILSLKYDDTDQIHYETARQSRSALGIGLIIR